MKQSSAIFLIFLLITSSYEIETNKKSSNQIKEKSFPVLLQKSFNEASKNPIVTNSDKSIHSNKIAGEQINQNETKEADPNSIRGSPLPKLNKSILNNDNIKPISNQNLSQNIQSSYDKISLISRTQTPIKSNENDDHDYSEEANIQCSEKNCFYPYGTCINITTCQCTREYASFKAAEETSHFYCAYERKKQLVSFLLEFFFPFGVGHFYAGRILIGMLKMIVCFSQCLFAGLGMCFAQDAGMVLMILLLVIGIVYISWEFIDIILISLNVYKDGNGVPLASW